MRAYTQQQRLEMMTKDRRALHKIPEFGYDLFKTRAYVRAELEKTAPDRLEACDEGIKVVYLAQEPKRGAIAFRADMDALRVTETTSHDFPSEHPGYMHACGHDGHMSGLLMLARIIGASRAELDRHVVLIFQPAEENQGGAKRMIAAGALSDPQVTEVYGLHLMPQIPKGKIGVKTGAMMAIVEAIDVFFEGKTAHGAQPHMGCDAVVAAAHFINSVQAGLSRRVNPPREVEVVESVRERPHASHHDRRALTRHGIYARTIEYTSGRHRIDGNRRSAPRKHHHRYGNCHVLNYSQSPLIHTAWAQI